MGTNKKRRAQNKGQKGRARRLKKDAGQTVNMIQRSWDDRYNLIPIFVNTCSIHRNIKGVPTTTATTCNVTQLMMGSPRASGSLDLDQFTPRFNYFPLKRDEPAARLGLFTEHRLDKLDHACLAAQGDIFEMANGPYTNSELKKVSVCNLMKLLRREALTNRTDLARFGDEQTNLTVCQINQNACWGLFFCEFYRLVNELLTEAPSLMPSSMGNIWGRNRLGFALLVESDTSKNQDFWKMVDATIAFVDTTINYTPCLLHPVGANQMLLTNHDFIDDALNGLVAVFDAPKSWIKMNSRKRVAMPWRKIANMARNLQGLFLNACVMTAVCVSQLYDLRGRTNFFEDYVFHEKIAEDPVLYGYTLRKELIKRFICEEKLPALYCFVPFDFAKFAAQLSMRTGVNAICYLPPYIRVREALSILLDNRAECGDYFRAYEVALGPKNRHVFSNMFARMKDEFLFKPLIKSENDIERSIGDYPELLQIVLRCKDKKLDEDTSTKDFHIVGDPEEWKKNVYSVWATAMTYIYVEYSCNRKCISTNETPSRWKPYNDPETAEHRNSLCPSIRRQLEEEARRRRVATVIKKHRFSARWRTFMRKLRGQKRLRCLALRMRAIAQLNELGEQKLENKARRIHSGIHAADIARRKIQMRQIAAECTMEIMRRTDEKNRETLGDLTHTTAYLEQFECELILQDLRRRLEYFVVHNVVNDNFLLQFRALDGSFPFHVFTTFPSLHGLLMNTWLHPFDMIVQACNRSPLIEAVPHGVKTRVYH